MAFFKPSLVFCLFLTFLSLNCGPCHVFAKVYMVVMEDDPFISYKVNHKHIMYVFSVRITLACLMQISLTKEFLFRRGEEAQKYKQVATTKHDSFLDSFLPIGSYKKLYSYTHLINGFALHAESAKVPCFLTPKTIRILSRAKGVRLIQEDIKMVKTSTHTPNYIGASGVWPLLGGSEHAGDGVVIGMIDTGIDPKNPSFVSSNMSSQAKSPPAGFKGICRAGNRFPADSCNGKIVGARWFARAAQESGEFNATIHYASPYDSDGHGRLAIYKAAYPFGGYMSDVIAAVDQAVEDGVDVISLSMAPSSVSPGPASFLNLLEVQLLLATKAGVSVVQAVGNAGPDENTVVSFSPWILSVAASTTDRKYRKSIIIGNGKSFSCGALSAPTQGEIMYPLALADDVMVVNSTDDGYNKCGDPKIFIKALVQGKVIICTFDSSDYYDDVDLDSIIDTIQTIGAAGVIITDRSAHDVDIEFEPTFPTTVPSAIVLKGSDMRVGS
ncbi:hypothetical protein HU200_042551 [Digitaria exilis]|uniref:Uncharacterized protein n=1 Tax=Digitaria exilis TaxID=1010633 RepID=A0A835BAP8_9POAL|nr:hypothetical protein HU200_042551 [Digitaria exilis]